MKKFFKYTFFLVLAIIIINVIISSGEETTTTGSTTTKVEEKQETKKSDKVTREQFDKVQAGDALSGDGGMTIQEVEAILGKGEKLTESQSGDMKMEFYSWKAEGEFGANVTVDFINGKASGKAQFGME